MSPSYLRHSRRLQQATFSVLFQSVPASVLKLARNVNQIGAILTIPSVNMDRTVLLECQFQLALIIVMRYVRRKKKEEDGEDENLKKVLGATSGSRANKSRPVSYFVRRVKTPWYFFRYHEFLLHDFNNWNRKLSYCVIHFVADHHCWCSHKIFSSQTIADNCRLACEVQLSSTSQASRRSKPGTDYKAAINVLIIML